MKKRIAWRDIGQPDEREKFPNQFQLAKVCQWDIQHDCFEEAVKTAKDQTVMDVIGCRYIF